MENTTNLAYFIANRIKYLRKQKKLSQEQLSLNSDLDIKYINKLENYRFNTKIDTLEKILDSLDISYQEFFQFNDISHNPMADELLSRLSHLPISEQKAKIKAILELIS